MNKEQRQFILYGLYAFLVLLLLLSIYRPLTIKLRNAQGKLNSLQGQLLSEQEKTAAFKKLDLTGRFMRRKELSRAIDEITEKGRALGLKFISITPKNLQRQASSGVKALPIAFEIECSYRGLGQFLIYLEEFPRTITEVENLTIRPREKKLSRLGIKVLVNLYIEDGKE